jgi:hypothetical protein
MLPEGVLTANGISCENSSLSRSPLKRVLHRKGQEASFPTRSESLYFHWVVEAAPAAGWPINAEAVIPLTRASKPAAAI